MSGVREKQKAETGSKARFLAEFTLSSFTVLRIVRSGIANGLGMTGLVAFLLVPSPWPLKPFSHPQTRGAAPTEYEIKAAYLYNFARFVEWTANATSAQAGSFELCVLGKDPFGPALHNIIAGESIGGKYVVAKRVSAPQDAGDCREVFISSSEDSQLGEILPALDEARALTVSDMPEFAQRGGMIGLISENNRVRFEVNLTAARRAGLSFSSQLLKVATKVIGAPEQAAEK